MAKLRLPKKMKTTGALKEFRVAFNDLRDFVATLVIMRSRFVKRRRTAIGTTLIASAPAEAEPAEAGMKFKGEWSSLTSYEKDDVVVVRGGTNGGTYIAIATVPAGTVPVDPTTTPEEGIFWVCLARDQASGVW